MEDLQKNLQRLQEEHTRLTQAKNRLQQAHGKAPEMLAEMERELPKLMVAVALGETPADALAAFKAELQILKEIAREPVQEAIKIIEARMKPVLDEMSHIHHSQRMAGNKARYQTARASIIAKGFYTVLELNEIESLASNSGDGQDLRRLVREIDDYIYRRELHGQAAGFPPFEYIPEILAG